MEALIIPPALGVMIRHDHGDLVKLVPTNEAVA